MISNKLTPLDPPLNMKKNLNDVLLKDISYQTENINDNYDIKISRTVNYKYNLSLQKKNLFDFIMNNCINDDDIIFNESNEQKYNNFLKRINYTSDNSDNSDNNKNIDMLINDIKNENQNMINYNNNIVQETAQIKATINVLDNNYYNSCIKLTEDEKIIINEFNVLISQFKKDVFTI
jgi:hypothetical protein